MSVEVRIPALLKSLVAGAKSVPAEGNTIAEVLINLEQRYPGIKSRLINDNGELKQFVNVFVNDEDIRFLQGLGTALRPGDVISILPAIAGGACGLIA